MKTTHPFGPRSRFSEKTGYPYLIVPFRWGTPKATGFKNVMPLNIYDVVKKYKKMSTEVSADSPNAKPMRNAKGEMVGRAKYNKGYGRLKGAEFGNMNGMVRTPDTTGKDRSGGYLSFRIISANPDAKGGPKNWVREGLPARHVTRAVAAETQPAIDAMVENAIKEDLGL
jgi:hypothetical protein